MVASRLSDESCDIDLLDQQRTECPHFRGLAPSHLGRPFDFIRIVLKWLPGGNARPSNTTSNTSDTEMRIFKHVLCRCYRLRHWNLGTRGWRELAVGLRGTSGGVQEWRAEMQCDGSLQPYKHERQMRQRSVRLSVYVTPNELRRGALKRITEGTFVAMSTPDWTPRTQWLDMWLQVRKLKR